MKNITSPQLLWDWGTAYDLFVSLWVLHDPAEFGIRGVWAAGVRARLPATERETLEQSQVLTKVPAHWLHPLPEPKDATAVLWALRQIPPAKRLPVLTLTPDYPPSDAADVLKNVASRRAWDEGDLEVLQAVYERMEEKKPPSTEELVTILDAWSHPDEFGERYLKALRAYQEVFFAEEEWRIRPALQRALSRAQELAEQLPLPDLLEQLSQGLRLDELPEATPLVLVPSYWSTPRVIFSKISAERWMYLFGARPPDASLVPGETVPDGMLRTLKALSDPTRLRILHYLAQEPLAPAQLARRLRLRVPTVTHHLKALRMAGLVRVTLGQDKETKLYAARSQTVEVLFDSLKGFLEKGGGEGPSETGEG